LPRITYSIIANTHERHIAGGTDLAHPTVRIECWAASHLEAKDLAKAVRQRLDNFTGTLGGGTTTVSVDICFLRSETDEFVPEEEATGRAVYKRTLDFEIWYRE